MRGRVIWGAGISLAAAAITAACAGPVTVPLPIPEPTGEIVTVCSDLDAVLPSAVLDQVRRVTEPESALTTAWGSPPITLRCGVPAPASLTPTSQLLTVNGVDWLPEQRSAGYVFVTFGRVANVEVAVPDAFAPESDVLVDLAEPIEKSVPRS